MHQSPLFQFQSILSPKKKPIPITLPILSFIQPVVTTNLVCLYALVYFGHFIYMELHNIWLFVSGLFHLTCCGMCQDFIPFCLWYVMFNIPKIICIHILTLSLTDWNYTFYVIPFFSCIFSYYYITSESILVPA